MKTAVAAAEPPRRVFRTCNTTVTYTAPMVLLVPTTTTTAGAVTAIWK